MGTTDVMQGYIVKQGTDGLQPSQVFSSHKKRKRNHGTKNSWEKHV